GRVRGATPGIGSAIRPPPRRHGPDPAASRSGEHPRLLSVCGAPPEAGCDHRRAGKAGHQRERELPLSDPHDARVHVDGLPRGRPASDRGCDERDLLAADVPIADRRGAAGGVRRASRDSGRAGLSAMDKEQYEIMYEVERTHWWYQGMRRNTKALLRRYLAP